MEEKYYTFTSRFLYASELPITVVIGAPDETKAGTYAISLQKYLNACLPVPVDDFTYICSASKNGNTVNPMFPGHFCLDAEHISPRKRKGIYRVSFDIKYGGESSYVGDVEADSVRDAKAVAGFLYETLMKQKYMAVKKPPHMFHLKVSKIDKKEFPAFVWYWIRKA